MLEILKAKIDSIAGKDMKLNVVREFLQILILQLLRSQGAFNNIAFIGGTALRIIYKINRYSEDLDFSLVEKNKYNFIKLMKGLKAELELLNLNADISYKENVVNGSMIKFNSLLPDLDSMFHHQEKLNIKIEIDTNPPLGYKLDTPLIEGTNIFNVVAFDISSLMAGKLHAILHRKYAKGRDFYDLLWYLMKNIEPNLELLNNSIEQSTCKTSHLTQSNWKAALVTQLEKLDFEQIQKDVRRFLISQNEVETINLNNFKLLLTK